jgi:hypothetical protein
MSENVVARRGGMPISGEGSSQRQFLLDQSVFVEMICEYPTLPANVRTQTDDRIYRLLDEQHCSQAVQVRGIRQVSSSRPLGYVEVRYALIRHSGY